MRQWLWAGLLCSFMAMADQGPDAAAPTPAAGTPDFAVKDGPGKEVFLNKCTMCHALNDVLAQRKNRANWESKVREMIGLGAPLNADDVKTISNYLAANYGQ